MRPLPSFGISGWSWLNAIGAHAYRVGDEPPTYRLDARGLSRQSLDLPGAWGRVKDGLHPLAGAMASYESRAAELLMAGVEPLTRSIEAARERYGADRVAIVLGSSTGGIDASERALAEERRTGKMPEDFVFEKAHVYHALIHLLSETFGLRGVGFVVSTACSSSGKALGSAQRLLSLGQADAVLTGGVDALCEMTLRGFAGLGILSPEGCRPFDATRDGISIGEGAALLLVERDTPSPFRLLGVGESSDAYHATAPHPEGLGARLAIQRALEVANLSPGAVDYVNAHGTGTEQNDVAEARALAEVFGATVRYSSTKDRVGHQLGTAGATEALFCLHALQTQTLPENRRPDRADPALSVQPLVERIQAPFETAQSNSFAFGGSNVSVLLGRRDSLPESGSILPRRRIFLLASALWTPGFATVDAWLEGTATDEGKPAALSLPARARGRASLLTRIYADLHEQLQRAHVFDPKDVALVFGSAYGEMETTLALLDQLGVDATLSPARFQSSVHNSAAGLLSLVTENRGFATALAAGAHGFAVTLLEASNWLSLHGGRALVLVADETGPKRMLRGRTFPPLGVGLQLTTADAPPPGAIAELGPLEPLDWATDPDSRASHASAPAAWGLSLVEHAARASSGTVRVGPRHGLRLQSLR